jgi:hypothetical protein
MGFIVGFACMARLACIEPASRSSSSLPLDRARPGSMHDRQATNNDNPRRKDRDKSIGLMIQFRVNESKFVFAIETKNDIDESLRQLFKTKV